MPIFARIRSFFRVSLLTLLLLVAFIGAAIGVYLKRDAWRIVLNVDDADGGTRPWSLALTNDGKRLAVGAEYKVELWDIDSRTRLAEAPDNDAYLVHNLKYTPDERSLMYVRVADEPKFRSAAVLRDARTLTVQRVIPDVSFAALSPDGTRVLCIDDRKARMLEWPSQTKLFEWRQLPSVKGTFSPDGTRMLLLNERFLKLVDPREPDQNDENTFAGGVLDAAFSADSKKIAVAGYQGLKLLTCEPLTPQAVPVETSHCNAVCFSRDGSRLAIMEFDECRVFEYPSFKEVCQFHCSGASKYTDIAMSEDGTVVAAASFDFGAFWVAKRQRREGPWGIFFVPETWIALAAGLLLIVQVVRRVHSRAASPLAGHVP